MSTTETTTCPYCTVAVGADEKRHACPSCGAVHHEDCWTENGGCAIPLCESRPQFAFQTAPMPSAPPPAEATGELPPVQPLNRMRVDVTEGGGGVGAGGAVPPGGAGAMASRGGGSRGRTGLILGGIAAALVVVVLVLVLSGGGGDSGPEATATPAPTVAADDVQKTDATATPTPSPTPSPEPTETPTPTATPTAGSDAGGGTGGATGEPTVAPTTTATP